MMSVEPMGSPFRVFVGYDSREDVAFRVCESSLRHRSSIALDVRPIMQSKLRTQGLYWRSKDPLASTEFTYTRFLTPYLAGYQGWALFCDCDFLWLADVAELLALADPAKAVMCVHHDHRPTETTKMDGAVQTTYPRKNWSSLMLFNCGHPMTRSLTPEVVNTASGAYLHRMQWAADEAVGELPATWNWLEGSMPKPDGGTPAVVHFTRGGPWFENWQHVDYADLWLAERAALAAPAAATE
jgi:lipopolysaccharide biosynthesis glycosyltransferase